MKLQAGRPPQIVRSWRVLVDPVVVGKFILGILVGIVIVIFILVQCTRAIF
jgi:hypothetical protein